MAIKLVLVLVLVLFYWKPNRLICLITGNPMYKRLPEWKKKETKQKGLESGLAEVS